MKEPLRGVNDGGDKVHSFVLVSRVEMRLITRYNWICDVIAYISQCKLGMPRFTFPEAPPHYWGFAHKLLHV